MGSAGDGSRRGARPTTLAYPEDEIAHEENPSSRPWRQTSRPRRPTSLLPRSSTAPRYGREAPSCSQPFAATDAEACRRGEGDRPSPANHDRGHHRLTDGAATMLEAVPQQETEAPRPARPVDSDSPVGRLLAMHSAERQATRRPRRRTSSRAQRRPSGACARSPTTARAGPTSRRRTPPRTRLPSSDTQEEQVRPPASPGGWTCLISVPPPALRRGRRSAPARRRRRRTGTRLISMRPARSWTSWSRYGTWITVRAAASPGASRSTLRRSRSAGRW